MGRIGKLPHLAGAISVFKPDGLVSKSREHDPARGPCERDYILMMIRTEVPHGDAIHPALLAGELNSDIVFNIIGITPSESLSILVMECPQQKIENI